MAKERKQRKFDWQEGRRRTTICRLARNNLIPISIRITGDEIVGRLIAAAMRQ